MLPILVVMMVVVRALSMLPFVAALGEKLEKPCSWIGLTATGLVAAVQLLFVNFAAPVESFKRMSARNRAARPMAATLALVLTLAQGNATFPLVADGLSLAVIPISLLGGIAASMVVYHGLGRWLDETSHREAGNEAAEPPADDKRSVMERLIAAGEDGVGTTLKAIPFLLFGFILMNGLRALGVEQFIQDRLSHVLGVFELPAAVSLPILTKYLAGGTAMLGVTHEMITAGAFSVSDLNRISGFLINPCDFVGIPLLMSPIFAAFGRRAWRILGSALLGATLGILVRAAVHLLIF